MTDYSDIIDRPHWEPQYHQRMPQETRAAQFVPFAPLAGHYEALATTAERVSASHQQDMANQDPVENI